MHLKHILRYLDLYLHFNLIITAKKDNLNVRHFVPHIEGLAAKHDVTAQYKFGARKTKITVACALL